MSRYSAIKAATNAYIKTNGRQEITGAILNAVMIATIDSLGKFYQFVGVATPDTNPGVIDQNIAYLAGTPGTYANLGNFTLASGEVAILKFDGVWEKEFLCIVPAKVSDLQNDLEFVTDSVTQLLNFYNKEEMDSILGAMTRQSYVVAWDGTAEPVVSDIPEDVSVTYNGNTYVGTLEASATTANKIYLVSNGAGYDEYITTENSGYFWLAFGTTSLDLSGYVTQEDFDALDLIVEGGDTEVATAETLTSDKYYNTNLSTLPSSTSGTLAGCKCAMIPVTPGQVFRIIGVRSTGVAYRKWVTADSNRGKLRNSVTGDGTTHGTSTITIESGEAYLYVNLVDYDSQTDGFWEITSQHIDGLVDRVADLEAENIPNVVDSLDSTSATDALSANQGRVLNEEINGVTTPTYTDQELQADKYFNTNTSRIPSLDNLSDLTGTYCCWKRVTPGEIYRIYGKGNSGAVQLYALADEDRYVVPGGTPGQALNTRTTPLDLTIPAGVSRMVVNLYQYDSSTDKVQLVGSTTSECIKTRLDALEEKDAEIESYALPLKGKKVMFFGDSITEFTYNGKGSVAYFADYSGATCYKAAVGGTRFVQRMTPVDNPTTNNQAYAALEICNMVKAWCEADYTKQDAACAFLGDYSARVTTLKNNPVSTIDIVVIGGGTNDVTNGSPIGTKSDSGFTTLWGVFNKMVELLLTANPALKIYFYSPVVGYRNNNRTDADWSDNYEYADGTRQEYVELFSQMARHSHIPYIDVYNTLGWNQTNFSQYFIDTDGTHPYKGFDVIARRLYGQMKALME